MSNSGEGFFFAGDPDLSKIKAQKALAQALMQRGMSDPGSAPYGGLSNAVNEIVGAYLGSRADKANSADYAKQLGALLGKEQPNTVQVTPQIQPDASGAPVPNASASYDQPASTFQGGQLGMAPDKAKLLASILQGVDPDQGRQALESLAIDQITPKPVQFHSPTDNVYDAQGNLLHAGTPEQKLQTAGGTYTLDGGKTWQKIPGYVEQAGAVSDARAAANAAHRAGPKPKPIAGGFGNPSSLF